MGSFRIDHAQQLWTSVDIVPQAGYTAATDKVFDAQGMFRKSLLIKNTGATAITCSVVGSMDGGTEYDVVHATGASVSPAGQTLVEFSNGYTHVKLQTKSAGATTVVVKYVASSN